MTPENEARKLWHHIDTYRALGRRLTYMAGENNAQLSFVSGGGVGSVPYSRIAPYQVAPIRLDHA